MFVRRLSCFALCSVAIVACNGEEELELEPEPPAPFGHDRTFEVVGDSGDQLAIPRDLEFNPEVEGELWTVNEDDDATVLFWIDEHGDVEDAVRLRDVSAGHFMHNVSSMAFGADSTFATCQESDNGGNNWMGPSLWSSDLEIYAAVNQVNPTPSTNGSHLDMLHASPWCMGIAHDEDNVYWVFDGHNGHLVRYDFQEDHGPGGDDHSDGIIRRFTEVELSRVDGVPGHMIMDHGTKTLFINDTGSGEVLWMDARSGEYEQDTSGIGSHDPNPIEEFSIWSGADFGVLADGLDEPSGIAFDGELLYVGEHGTAQIIAFDLDGQEVERIDTPATALMGLTIGPDGRLWYVDGDEDEVVRIEPTFDE